MKPTHHNDSGNTEPRSASNTNPDNVDLELGQVEPNSGDNLDREFIVEQLKHELVEAEKRVLLAQAELENFRRRMRRDMQDQLKYNNLALLAELLEAVDNLHRAIDSHQRDPNSNGLIQGVQLVAQQISQTLQNHGCQKIEAAGQPFDPNLHQAVQTQTTSEVPPNTVLMDLRSGFLLHDRVIRPSQVSVSTAPQQ